MKIRLPAPVAAIFVGAFASSSAFGTIIVSGGVTSGTFDVEITRDIEFQATGTGNALYIVFDNWVTTDGTSDGASLNGGTPFQFIVNSPPTSFINAFGIVDNGVASNNGLISLIGGLSLTSGDVVTLKAGLWNFNGVPNFNPQAESPFTGTVYLGDSSSNPLTTNGSFVPEPSVLVMLGVATTAFLRRRRGSC